MISTLVVASTALEVKHLIDKGQFELVSERHYVSKLFSGLSLFISGVGMMEAAVNLSFFLSNQDAKRILHVGIAGTTTKELNLLDVVFIASETYGDLGSSDFTVFDLGLKDVSEFPFVDGCLLSAPPFFEKIKSLVSVNSISVNGMLATKDLARRRGQRHHSKVEHMEGVGIFYVANKQKIKLNAIRVISNVAGESDKSKWKIDAACKKLSSFVFDLF